MTSEFLKNILSIPNPSGREDFIKECIEGWCKTAGVSVKYDGKGNMYLTKGRPNDAGYYVCGTAHLDSVIEDAEKAVDEKRFLDVEFEGGRMTATLDGKPCVIGGDDKCAIAILLSVIARVPSFKIAFFVEEEMNGAGSQNLDKSFFDDVSWVMGFDSPGPSSRATLTCLGYYIYSKEFAQKFEEVCKRFGVTDFRKEEGTDVMFIKLLTGIDCCNISNGGYALHTTAEYVVYEEVNDREKLALALYDEVPSDRQWKSKANQLKKEEPLDIFGRARAETTSAAEYWRKYWMDKMAAEKSAPAETDPNLRGSEETCSMEFEFETPEKAAFFEKIAGSGMQPESDETGKRITLVGPLGRMKQAYATWHDIAKGTSYGSWKRLSKEGDINGFWNSVTFDGGDEAPSAKDMTIDVSEDEIDETVPENPWTKASDEVLGMAGGKYVIRNIRTGAERPLTKEERIEVANQTKQTLRKRR